MTKPIGENSSLNISLPMLIQAIGFIGALVYGYGQLNTRLQFVEHQSSTNKNDIEGHIQTIYNEIERLRDGKGN